MEKSLNQKIEMDLKEVIDLNIKLKDYESLQKENEELKKRNEEFLEKIKILENENEKLKEFQSIQSNEKEMKNKINLENKNIKVSSVVNRLTINVYFDIIKSLDDSDKITISTKEVRIKGAMFPFSIEYLSFTKIFGEILKKKLNLAKTIENKICIPTGIVFKEYCEENKLENIVYENDDIKKINLQRVNVCNFSRMIEKIEDERVNNGKQRLFKVIKYR